MPLPVSPWIKELSAILTLAFSTAQSLTPSPPAQSVILHSFKLATSGDNPAVGFVADPDGRLYTGVNSGGSGFRGTIVRITP
jgi:hypothetical protein